MERRRFDGAQVPVIGEGTWKLGGREAVQALRAGLDAGLTHIDTAEMYGTEELVAEAIEGRRKEVFLVSKVLPSNATRRGTVHACEQSLRRLRTDRLDCYLLHWPGSHPLEDTIAGFEDLLRAGKIGSYGVSNFDQDLLREAVGIAGAGKIACDQVLYNLGERHVEAKLLPVCRELGVALVGYSPFNELDEDGTIGEVAQQAGCTPRQAALAFLTRLPDTFAIPKASRAAHAEQNAGAAKVKLTAAQTARLDKAYPVKIRAELPVI